ncbi:unnamed protein product [Pieris macdunnoughi]|uniref:Uncharacterized protein n=1 Tax=Pieris macdunnoughi TaxID=345717 RepID=A0A821RP69_9NEOP|nr:unnamed protein product [Pieris macdunnoughi]
MHRILLLAVLGVANAYPVLFDEPLHAGIEYAPLAPAVHSHPSVELNAASEAQLPRELLKSNAFYDNPAIAAGLAKESWFTNKEMQVVEREAEKIPRQRIYDMVKGAGFLDQH